MNVFKLFSRQFDTLASKILGSVSTQPKNSLEWLKTTNNKTKKKL
jgi:hypothetical protein